MHLIKSNFNAIQIVRLAQYLTFKYFLYIYNYELKRVKIILCSI